MMVPSSHAEIGCREESENGCWRTARSYCESSPLYNFSEEIGSRYVVEQTTGRNFVASFSRFAQVNQQLICW